MRYLTGFFSIFIFSACFSATTPTEHVALRKFDRQAAQQQYQQQCMMYPMLAMGLTEKKENGQSKESIEKQLRSSERSEFLEPMLQMLPEVFGMPALQKKTYIAYKYDSCLISKVTSQAVVSLDSIRSTLLQCEGKGQEEDTDALASCVDSVIINQSEKRN